MDTFGASNSAVTRVKDRLLDRLYGYSVRPVGDVDAPLDQFGRVDGRSVFALRPSPEKEVSGIDASVELLGGLHEFGGRVSFEIWHADSNRIVLTTTDDRADQFRHVVSAFFPNAEMEAIDTDPVPETECYVSAATTSLRNDYYLQLRHPFGATQMRTDPYEVLLDRMNALPSSVRAVYQVALTPADDDWTSRTYVPFWSAFTDDDTSLPLVEHTFSADSMADEMERGGADSTAQSLVRRQEDAFLVNVRVLTFAPDPGLARSAAETLGGCLGDSFDDPQMDQGLLDRGVPDYLLETSIAAAVNRTVFTQRERVGKFKRSPMTLTPSEVASLAHVPSTVEQGTYHFEGGDIEWADLDDQTDATEPATADDPGDADESTDASS